MKPDKISNIELSLIDEPEEAMRSRFDQQALIDLAESIKTNGLIQPIVVKQKGDRFEVVAGHRRLQAYRLLKLPEIPSIVKDYTDDQAESAKVHENIFREDVNPVDQAVFLAKYIERTKSKLPDVARMLNRSEAWLGGRLEILTYPDYMIDLVRDGKISLGVATWLNEIPTETKKRDYTRFASIQGINIKTAKKWATQSLEGTLPNNPANLPKGVDPFDVRKETMKVKCAICQLFDEVGLVQSDFLHPSCRDRMAAEMDSAAQRERERVEGDPAPEANAGIVRTEPDPPPNLPKAPPNLPTS